MNSLTQLKKIIILPSLIAPALIALASPPVARADAVTDWNLIASNAIVVTAGQPPPVSVLHFAMVHGAVYDAVNAIDRGHRQVVTARALGNATGAWTAKPVPSRNTPARMTAGVNPPRKAQQASKPALHASHALEMRSS